jgi:hypothetical protein
MPHPGRDWFEHSAQEALAIVVLAMIRHSGHVSQQSPISPLSFDLIRHQIDFLSPVFREYSNRARRAQRPTVLKVTKSCFGSRFCC